MSINTDKRIKRFRRRIRVRAKISGTSERPRLAVFKSNKYLYAQLIDDSKGVTIASATSRGAKGKDVDQSALIGKLIADKAKEKKISRVVFDRGGFLYRGKIKAIADSARAAGLTF
jgi:large subunit ribosomal protein L18